MPHSHLPLVHFYQINIDYQNYLPGNKIRYIGRLTSEISVDSHKGIEALRAQVENDAKQRRQAFQRLTQAQDRTQVQIELIQSELSSVASQLHHMEEGLTERLLELEKAMQKATVGRSRFLLATMQPGHQLPFWLAFLTHESQTL
jgi:hypothetical protein